MAGNAESFHLEINVFLYCLLFVLTLCWIKVIIIIDVWVLKVNCGPWQYAIDLSFGGLASLIEAAMSATYHYIKHLHCVPQNIHLFIFQITLSKINRFWWFLVWILRKFDINSVYICPPHLYTVATSPWKIHQSHFQQYYSYILQIIYIISEENKLLPPYPPHLKNVTTLPFA